MKEKFKCPVLFPLAESTLKTAGIARDRTNGMGWCGTTIFKPSCPAHGRRAVTQSCGAAQGKEWKEKGSFLAL